MPHLNDCGLLFALSFAIMGLSVNARTEHDPMHWLQLTQAQTGATIYVNMRLVILVAPNKTGGAALVTIVREKESARVVPVCREPPADYGYAEW